MYSFFIMFRHICTKAISWVTVGKQNLEVGHIVRIPKLYPYHKGCRIGPVDVILDEKIIRHEHEFDSNTTKDLSYYQATVLDTRMKRTNDTMLVPFGDLVLWPFTIDERGYPVQSYRDNYDVLLASCQ